MRYISLCSGIEAATVAWEPLRFVPAGFAEIEKFPSAVLAHHYPDVPNLGDITQIKGEDYAGRIDLVVGGTPCQGFSVAGLRGGLDDERSNLCLSYVKFCLASRSEWLLWENVPGVFSSKGGEDFSCFLSALSGMDVPAPIEGWRNSGVVIGAEGFYSLAWRVLDAQHFGVPQRRRRVFVIGYLGDWRRAAAVLFERQSMSGYPAPSREAGKRVAGSLSARTEGGGGFTVSALTANPYGDNESQESKLIPIAIQAGATRENADSGPDGVGIREDGIAYTLEARSEVQVVAFSCKDHGADVGETSPTLRAMGHDGSHANAGGQVAVAMNLRGRDGGAMPELDDVASIRAASGGSSRSYVIYEQEEQYASTYEADASSILSTMRKQIGAEAVAEWGSRILDSLQSPEVLRSWMRGESLRRSSEDLRSFVDDRALSCTQNLSEGTLRTVWVLGPNGRTSQGRGLAKQLAYELGEALQELPHQASFSEDLMLRLRKASEGIRTLRQALSTIQEVREPADGKSQSAHPSMAVRRLTPTECERLMGFPDNYTKISDKTADGPRYKALGNSMAVPCMRWLGKRIQLVNSISKSPVDSSPHRWPQSRH